MAGRKVMAMDVLERIADGCAMPDHARRTLTSRRALPEMTSVRDNTAMSCIPLDSTGTAH